MDKKDYRWLVFLISMSLTLLVLSSVSLATEPTTDLPVSFHTPSLQAHTLQVYPHRLSTLTGSPTTTRPSNPLDGQGLYDDCVPGDSVCQNHLATFAQAGFTLVLNYASLGGTPAQLIAYADKAQAVGIKIIWGLHNTDLWSGSDPADYYPALSAACHCADGVALTRYAVNLVKHLPATWGYYIGDEVKANNHALLKAHAELIHQTDPAHPRLLVQGLPSTSTTDPSLATFADTAEVIAEDYYPIGVSYLVPYTQTGTVARNIQSIADQTHKQSAFVLQSMSWQQVPPARCSPYPDCAAFPTKEQMQQMLRLTLENSHPRLILWYSYFQILQSDNPLQHWSDLVAVASGK